MPSIRIDVELDEFDTDDLLDEIEERFGSNSDNKMITEFCNRLSMSHYSTVSNFEIESLQDELKIQALSKLYEKLTLEQIENLTNKYL